MGDLIDPYNQGSEQQSSYPEPALKSKEEGKTDRAHYHFLTAHMQKWQTDFRSAIVHCQPLRSAVGSSTPG